MTVNKDDPWHLVSKLRSSDQKTKMVEEIADNPSCASELSDVLGIQTGTAANYLRDLKNTEPPIVECITPEQPHYRLYALTSEGRFVYEEL